MGYVLTKSFYTQQANILQQHQDTTGDAISSKHANALISRPIHLNYCYVVIIALM